MFQLPPHHFLILSPPHSSYSAFVTPTRANSSVCAKSAIPLQLSADGSRALTIFKGTSGERMGRRVDSILVARPGSLDGLPVKNTAWKASVSLQFSSQYEAHLSQPGSFCCRECGQDVLDNFSYACRVYTCHARGKPRFTHPPPFCVEVDPRFPWTVSMFSKRLQSTLSVPAGSPSSYMGLKAEIMAERLVDM